MHRAVCSNCSGEAQEPGHAVSKPLALALQLMGRGSWEALGLCMACARCAQWSMMAGPC